MALTCQRSPWVKGLKFENTSFTDIPTVIEYLEKARIERSREEFTQLVDLVAGRIPAKSNGKDPHYEHVLSKFLAYLETVRPDFNTFKNTTTYDTKWGALLDARWRIEKHQETVREVETQLRGWGERGQRLLHIPRPSDQNRWEAIIRRARVVPHDVYFVDRCGENPAPVTTQDLEDFDLIINDLGLVKPRPQSRNAQLAAAQDGEDQSAHHVSRRAEVDDDDHNERGHRSRKRRRL
ncbi:hypothetical protein BO86DRAFT_404517 [Aspergillus japonicus CBS 114.51]|uniref:Uncharacterized protein n=1 Tax=Aspergillus japonicus CBS 114.51 TaxID=1448312 RepID=A0A8T8WLJ9_ASPJA|nr:hypothetical protein BO86DRAFT_404517 [Aspergillus japonicus CBS 114.51]RAH76583.1 hypothetical protein BO86DRAFT_404517 [Aspergillus japonicus CBS 114.51]